MIELQCAQKKCNLISCHQPGGCIVELYAIRTFPIHANDPITFLMVQTSARRYLQQWRGAYHYLQLHFSFPLASQLSACAPDSTRTGSVRSKTCQSENVITKVMCLNLRALFAFEQLLSMLRFFCQHEQHGHLSSPSSALFCL